MSENSLFARLCARLAANPDSQGEVHVDCPFCGKEAKRGQTHASFSERGFHCFVCGQGTSLAHLAEMLLGREAPEPVVPAYPRQTERARKPVVPGRLDEFSRLAELYASSTVALAYWLKYKPVPEEAVSAYRLGLGAYPKHMSRCEHQRLQVPLIAQGKVVGFRGRQLVWRCSCGKWLSPSGSRMILYNGERLTGEPHEGMGYAYGWRPIAGKVLFIVENPIDALLLEARYPRVCAVATLGVTIWQAAWTELVARARPGLVIVAYDNDRPGNGGGQRGKEAWLADPKHKQDIVPNGIRLANRLLEAGVRARLVQWAGYPLKTDVGDALKGATCRS